jgi:hypothetical protein
LLTHCPWWIIWSLVCDTCAWPLSCWYLSTWFIELQCLQIACCKLIIMVMWLCNMCIIYIANHYCLVDDMLNTVKHDPRIFQISPTLNIFMQQSLLCCQPYQPTSWRWRPSNLIFSMENNIPRCKHNNF